MTIATPFAPSADILAAVFAAPPVTDTYELEISPAVATVFLNLNTHNRVLRPTWVNELAERMTRGEWRVTHQGVAVSRDRVLLDGQHRLWAVLESGVTVRMRVTYNADPATFDVLDTGRKRDLGDLTHTPKHAIDVITRLARFVLGHHPSAAEAQPYLRAYLPTIVKLRAACGTIRRRASAAPVRASAVVRMLATPAQEKYVMDNYRRMVLVQYSEAPAVFSALIKQLDTTPLTPDETMVRAFYAFGHKNGKSGKIQVKNFDDDRNALRALILSQIAS